MCSNLEMENDVLLPFQSLQIDQSPSSHQNPIFSQPPSNNENKSLLFTNHAGIRFRQYHDERDLNRIVSLISKDLSEPYSIYTYRYFIYYWPELCILAFADSSKDQSVGVAEEAPDEDEDEGEFVGTVVCKLDVHRNDALRGYIAMLAVKEGHRRKGIGSCLVDLAVKLMAKKQCDEVTLETEVSNTSALSLYENMGFCRDKRLLRYYLNDADAFQLKLWLTSRTVLKSPVNVDSLRNDIA